MKGKGERQRRRKKHMSQALASFPRVKQTSTQSEEREVELNVYITNITTAATAIITHGSHTHTLSHTHSSLSHTQYKKDIFVPCRHHLCGGVDKDVVMWVSLIVVFWGITVTVFLITDLVSAFEIYVAYSICNSVLNLDNR